GLLCGREDLWARVTRVQSTWGWSTSPFDCWLALRGLGTLALRAERSIANAADVAAFLEKHAKVERVDYPGLANHADHDLAARQFARRWGNMVTFHLRGGVTEAERFIAAARSIPFCPSLGDLATTLSHPASTSHRSLSTQARAALGIGDATIRLSIGIESSPAILAALEEGLAAIF
ncbi:MAG: PLP-dependent transferase, partial [Pirellulales bacterium]